MTDDLNNCIVLPDHFILDLEEKLAAMRDIRKRGGLSQQDVADRLGIDQSRVARWEKGQEYPRYETLVLLTRLLDNIQLQE